MLGGLTQPETTGRALVGISRAYTTALGKPTPQVDVKETGATSCIVRLTDFWLFLDSHQIGILEGAGRACGVRLDVRIALEGLAKGELSCSWELAPASRAAPASPRVPCTSRNRNRVVALRHRALSRRSP